MVDNIFWNREWSIYYVESILGEHVGSEPWPSVEHEAISSHEKSKSVEWKSVIVELKSPICTSVDVAKVIDTGRIRIYPPFEVNKKASISSSLADIGIPVGFSSQEKVISVPNYATTGLSVGISIANSKVMYGIRIDYKEGEKFDEHLEFFLRLVRQYTRQWWVNSPRNPFDTGLRLYLEVNKDYSPRELLRYRGAGEVPSPWLGAAGTQGLVGFELPLGALLWDEVAKCMRIGYGIEVAAEYFISAVANFKQFEDRQCILNLALMFEVAENKARILENSKTISRNKEILRNPLLALKDELDTFRKLVTDRDNIAHGRKPFHSSRNPDIVTEYLQVSTSFINRYFEFCKRKGWDKTLKISLLVSLLPMSLPAICELSSVASGTVPR